MHMPSQLAPNCIHSTILLTTQPQSLHHFSNISFLSSPLLIPALPSLSFNSPSTCNPCSLPAATSSASLIPSTFSNLSKFSAHLFLFNILTSSVFTFTSRRCSLPRPLYLLLKCDILLEVLLPKLISLLHHTQPFQLEFYFIHIPHMTSSFLCC